MIKHFKRSIAASKAPERKRRTSSPRASESEARTPRELRGGDTHSQAQISKQLAHLREGRQQLQLDRSDWESDRHLENDARQDSEAAHDRYVDLYDFAPVGYLTLNRSGCIGSINLTGVGLFGRDRSHLIGRPMVGFLAPKDRRPFLRHLREAVASCGRPVTNDLWLARKGGGFVLLQFISLVDDVPLSGAVRIRTAIIDVTERRREGEARRRLAAIVEYSDDAIVGKNLNGTIISWNRGAERLFGYTASEIIGRSVTLLIPHSRQDEEAAILSKICRGEAIQHYETIRRRKDGSEVSVSLTVSPVRDETGKVIGASKIARDITRRKEAEKSLRQAKAELEERVQLRTVELTRANELLTQEIAAHKRVEFALRQSEERLQAIMDNSSAMIFLKDTEGRYLHHNREFSRVFQVSANGTIGKTDFELFPRAQAAAFRNYDRKVIATGQPVQFEMVIKQDDGPHVSIFSAFPVCDEERKVRAVGCIVTDITERRRLEQEVLQISERERMRIAQDLHDSLGQQLAGTWFFADTLRKDLAASSAPNRSAAAKICQLLDEAVSQSRGLSRGLYPVPRDPNGLFSALEELARRVSDMFNVKCRLVCPKAVQIENNEVATNLYRIAQEATNNAMKHGQPRSIEIGLSAIAGRVRLTVRDDGRGFKLKPKAREGMGLRTMSYRADSIGADFAIYPIEPCGTEVVCRLRNQLNESKSNTKRK